MLAVVLVLDPAVSDRPLDQASLFRLADLPGLDDGPELEPEILGA